MSIFTKARLKIIALVSFILTIITGWLGFQQSMMAYGTPEMMASNPDPFGAGKLMIAALVFLIITVVSFVASFFKKK
jgi:hypothetical protein